MGNSTGHFRVSAHHASSAVLVVGGDREPPILRDPPAPIGWRPFA